MMTQAVLYLSVPKRKKTIQKKQVITRGVKTISLVNPPRYYPKKRISSPTRYF